MSDAPAEADKSFLLPLTSSILRAHELISEPDLEASPFAQNNKNNSELEENTCKNVSFSVWQKSSCYEFASKHRSRPFFWSEQWVKASSNLVRLLYPWSQSFQSRRKQKDWDEEQLSIIVMQRNLSKNETETPKSDNTHPGTVQKHGRGALCCHWSSNGFTTASVWLWGVSDFTNARRLHSLTLITIQIKLTLLFSQELDIHPTYLSIAIWWRMKMLLLNEHNTKNSVLRCQNLYSHRYIAYTCMM